MTDEHKMARKHMVEHHIGRRCLRGARNRCKRPVCGLLLTSKVDFDCVLLWPYMSSTRSG